MKDRIDFLALRAAADPGDDSFLPGVPWRFAPGSFRDLVERGFIARFNNPDGFPNRAVATAAGRLALSEELQRRRLRRERFAARDPHAAARSTAHREAQLAELTAAAGGVGQAAEPTIGDALAWERGRAKADGQPQPSGEATQGLAEDSRTNRRFSDAPAGVRVTRDGDDLPAPDEKNAFRFVSKLRAKASGMISTAWGGVWPARNETAPKKGEADGH